MIKLIIVDFMLKSSDLNGFRCYCKVFKYENSTITEDFLNGLDKPYGGFNIWFLDSTYKNSAIILISAVTENNKQAIYARGIILSYYTDIKQCIMRDGKWKIETF